MQFALPFRCLCLEPASPDMDHRTQLQIRTGIRAEHVSDSSNRKGEVASD